MARQLGAIGQLILGVALPVSNVPGASGNAGIGQLLNSKPDGYTIATYGQDTLMTIPMGLAPYSMDDFEWIARTQVASSFLFVRADSRFKTVHDLLKQAQANPGRLRVATAGPGSVDDVSVLVLARHGYKMTAVPYPKPGERHAAALRGYTDVLYAQAGDVLPYLKAKQLRPLVVFADRRHAAFPDAPTSKELGIDLALPTFLGIVARKGAPPDRIQTLAAAFRRATETSQWKHFAEAWYFAPDGFMGPDRFGAWVAGELETLDHLVRDFGLKKESRQGR
jgi:tripartite-type tricarboxylate transporter receptor subunit TctC